MVTSGGIAPQGDAVGQVGVVVLDFDQAPLTQRCLVSIADGSRRPGVLVVVSNGERPPSLYGRALEAADRIVVLRPGRNLGCAGGRNFALDRLVMLGLVSRFVILDNDTVVPPDFVAMVAEQQLRPLEVAAPVINEMHTGRIWSVGGVIGLDGTLTQLSAVPVEGASSIDVHWAPGACLIMDRATWQVSRPFDEWMGFLFEDVEWCHRLRQLGGRITVFPRLLVEHEPNQSLGGRWSPARVRLWARNGTVFRSVTLRNGFAAVMRWVLSELVLSARDLLAGKPRWAAARFGGLIEGLWTSGIRLATA